MLAQKSREPGSFVPLPIAVLNSDNWARLSAHSKAVLMALLSQIRWKDYEYTNGDLSASWKVMNVKGVKSRDTLHRCLKELIENGWIEVTRHGGRHVATLYAVTFLAIGHCKGKLEVTRTVRPTSRWREIENRSGTTRDVSIAPRMTRESDKCGANDTSAVPVKGK